MPGVLRTMPGATHTPAISLSGNFNPEPYFGDAQDIIDSESGIEGSPDSSVDNPQNERCFSDSILTLTKISDVRMSSDTSKGLPNERNGSAGNKLKVPLFKHPFRRSSLQSETPSRERVEPGISCSAPAGATNLEHLDLHCYWKGPSIPTIRVLPDASQGDGTSDAASSQRRPSTQMEVSLSTKNTPKRSPTKNTSPATLAGAYGPLGATASPLTAPVEIPTDFSDTNGSDADREKLGEIVVCPNISSHHLGREIINAVFALPIDTVFTLLFTNSTFMLDLYAARKTYDVSSSPWRSNPETNQKIRQVTYVVTLPTNSFGPKVSHVTETQVISSFSKPGEIYTVDAEACNSGIPYADSFYVSNHWCLTRENANETRLLVWSIVKYKKNVWGFMKSVIDKNAFSGMENLMSDIHTALLLEVDKTNQKRTRRRRRRIGSKSCDHSDALHITLPGDKGKDIHKATQIPQRKTILPTATLDSPNQNMESTSHLSVFILILLLLLNAFLYHRLWMLEDKIGKGIASSSLYVDPNIFKFSNAVDESLMEEWVHILHQQEVLHSAEVERWRKAVIEAADHLKKAEEALRNLHASIPHSQATKLQSLLKQLQIIQQMQSKEGAGGTKGNDKAPRDSKEVPIAKPSSESSHLTGNEL